MRGAGGDATSTLSRARVAVSGVVLDSALPLEGVPAGPARPDFVVDVGAAEPAPPVDGWMVAERTSEGISLRFSGLARFAIAADGVRITCHPAPGVPEPTLAHLLLDHVLPRLLAGRGQLVLHASAVRTGRGAVAFCGETGAGKSTLAASFALAGAELLSDDVLVVDESPGVALARPSYPAVRLWPADAAALSGSAGAGAAVAHYTEKRRVGLADLHGAVFGADAEPLARVYLLSAEPSEAVGIEPVRARDAFLALSAQLFRLDATDRAANEALFERLARSPLLRACRTLRYPRGHARLPEVRAAIEADLAAAGSG